MNSRLLLVVLLISPFFIKAQAPDLNSAEIKASLNKLQVLGSVLYIAAHPDDENTRLLTYLAKERLVRTGYLSLTRGDGGQNLIGKEQSEELGLIRTQELIAARTKDGAEQFFTRANDFGFSKTPKETFSIWNKQQILSDVVYVIRKFKPDVIITRFPSDSRAGHGHHSASSILAQEAFDAAADPKKFPEQLKEVDVWQAKRILWNNYNFSGNSNISEDQFKVDVGVYNHLLGKNYGEIAAESRSMHKSQGFGAARQRGANLEYFSTLKGDAPKVDLFDGVDITWARVGGSQTIASLVKTINKDYDVEHPGKSIPALINLYQQIAQKGSGYYHTLKLKEVANVILSCSGTWIEAYSPKPFISENTSFKATINAISQTEGVEISLADGLLKTKLEPNKLATLERDYAIAQPTSPYWLVKEHGIGQYELESQSDLLSADGPFAKLIPLKVNIGGLNIPIQRPLWYKYTDQVRGEVYQPLVITPPVTANLVDKVLVYADNQPKDVVLKLKAFKGKSSGSVSLELPEGWKSSPGNHEFRIENEGEEQFVSFKVIPSASAISGDLNVKITASNGVYHHAINTISYEHIPSITYFSKAKAKLVKVDLKIAENRNIGYVEGAGDLIPEALTQIGYHVKILKPEELLNGDLSVYDAIITGVRAYNVNDNLKTAQTKLLDYVKNGGVFLSQYNVNRPLVLEKIGPYPFTITRDRVTEENSPIQFLLPQHKSLNSPNKITLKDFDGWIQERGLYFLSDVDAQYQLPLKMNDTDDAGSDGSLAIASFGKGKFVYTGLSFFRELPAGVPGAYRLFVNLITK